ncbi:hypothetical protein IMSHALPRED_006091 [Imshaugia aleurites]|uniref:Uncharacterized protein n=1 Tax=Imshaugia aleurites TaxID=172621 RepID=A0A8H3FN70_9LECA|nr:hypothetical protein IMSHALPRED_006091 [Imshaugia aleurites]
MILIPYLLLPSALSSLSAFASPPSYLQTSNPFPSPLHPISNHSSPPNDNLHCTDLVNPFSRRPKYPDCVLAIRQLPRGADRGSFHNHGPADPFLLPVGKISGTCAVTVELYAGRATVGASWLDIVSKANMLNRLCLRTVLPLYRGGWASFARDERIVISLAYAGRFEEGQGVANMLSVDDSR